MGVENNIPKGWVETSIGKVTVVESGGTPSTKNSLYWSDEIPWITPRDLSSFKDVFIEKGERSISIEGLKNSSAKLLPKNTILFSSRAPIGYVVIAQNETATNQGFKNLICDEVNSHFKYFYYLMKFKADFIERLSSGSTFSEASGTLIKSIELNLPPLPEQKSIAKALTVFDDKIELLQAQNKTLETMAQTIFKEWFGKYQIGDELPEGWRVGVIGDLIEIKRGGSPRPIKDYISDSGYRWLKISDASATSSPYIFIIKEHIKKEGLKKTTLKHKGDLVLSNSATPGIPKFLAVDTCVHDGWMHFPSAKVSNEYLYLLFLNIRPKLVQQGSGSVFVNLKTDTLRQFETIIASKNDFEAFDNLIKPIFTKIYNNALQIQSLTKTRDTLLPKLMSGQVRVNNIKQTADA